VPAFLWPMLADLKIPALVIRGSQSDMLDAPTLEKTRQSNPRVQGIELEGSHDLANDNPDGLVSAIRSFLDTSNV
jgi:pimeloyl-ACP methyl ester carboxylesterase